MSRQITIPGALYIERVEHIPGRSDPLMVIAEKLPAGSYVDVDAARAIYARLGTVGDDHRTPGVRPAVVIEHASVHWLFIMRTDDEALKWARRMSK